MTYTEYNSVYIPRFAFTQADLQANRNGQLSPNQRLAVEAAYAAREVGARQTYRAFATWIPLLMLVGLLVEHARQGKSLAEFLPTMFPMIAVIAIFLVVLVSISWVISKWISQDARNQRISAVEGVARLVVKSENIRYGRYTRYHVTLRRGLLRTTFRFADPASIAHFTEGERYRVYYIKYYPFPLVLSAERV